MEMDELTEVSGGLYAGPCKTVIVQKNDCLASIASRYHTSVPVLRQLNPQKQDPLRPGMTLLVPSLV